MTKLIAAIAFFECLLRIPATRPVEAQTLPQAEFEVAAIKPAAAGVRASFTEIAPGGERFTATHTTLKLLIMTAYGVTDRQVSGGPSWVNSEYYDVEAKAPHRSEREQILQMLQTLLADRFQRKLHKETKEVPIYVLGERGTGVDFARTSPGTAREWELATAGNMFSTASLSLNSPGVPFCPVAS